MAPSMPRDLHGNGIREGERERGEQRGEQSEQRGTEGAVVRVPEMPVVSDNRLAAKPAALGKKRKQRIEHVGGGTACFLTAD